MTHKPSHFREAFTILSLSTMIFLGFKEILPKDVLAKKLGTSKSSANIVVDSLLLEAVSDAKGTAQRVSVATKNSDGSAAYYTLQNDSVLYPPINSVALPSEALSNYTGMNNLIPVFEKLHSLEQEKTGTVRIAYFGDSQTDGDRIVEDVRTLFQGAFGGKGVGFVSIASESASGRRSITHKYSDQWKIQSFLKAKQSTKPFGISGNLCYVQSGSSGTWVKYKAGENDSVLCNPTLFYGSSSNSSAKVTIETETDTISKALTPNDAVNTLALTVNSPRKIGLDFIGSDSIPVYGCNFDDGKGVHVDNFSTRGNSGLPLGVMNTSIMQGFQAKLGYDLLILQYGTNVLGYGTNEYGWYEKKMNKVITHLKECFPGVAIVIISTADKASKYGSDLKTDEAVVPLVNSQRNFALQSGCGFINLYELMGGDSSMIKWVNATPSKANKDYTHFNYRGAKIVSELIYKEIYTGYELYKTQQRLSLTSGMNRSFARK